MSDDRIAASEHGPFSDDGPLGTTERQTTVTTINRLLSSPRRRVLLSFLSVRDREVVDRDRLVGAIAERETPKRDPTSHRNRITVDLHHVHLPKLADAGVITYDPVDETVRYDGSELLERLLVATTAEDEESSRSP